MISDSICSSSWLVLLALLTFAIAIPAALGREGVHNTLKCYQCDIKGTDEALCDSDLLTCPNNQAYDRCMINTKRNATTGQITISKACALAPCEFEKEVETIIFSGKCDLNRWGADCVRCCAGDGCNKRSDATLTLTTDRRLLDTILPAALLINAALYIVFG